jgi:hypothetical protein
VKLDPFSLLFLPSLFTLPTTRCSARNRTRFQGRDKGNHGSVYQFRRCFSGEEIEFKN